MNSIFLLRELSQYIGIEESLLKVFISLLLHFPLSFLFRLNPSYFSAFLSGLLISLFNYGHDTIYIIIPIVFCYFGMVLNLPRHFLSCSVFAYLMGWYWHYDDGETYIMNWTTSFCVITLRLIALIYDTNDSKSVDDKNTIWKNRGISGIPSLLGILGYCFFYGGFLVGPVFPFKYFDEMLKGLQGPQDKDERNECLQHSKKCAVWAIILLIVSQSISSMIPVSFLISKEIEEFSFPRKIFVGIGIMTKYVFVWVLNESAGVLGGLGRISKGKDKHGKEIVSFDGLSNTHPYDLLSAQCFAQIIQAFNINTNNWSKEYIFKRFIFLGNKSASSLITLAFLALWHGWSPTYLEVWFTEFLYMEAEKTLGLISYKIFGNSGVENHFVLKSVKWIITWIFMAYAVVPFSLISVTKTLTFLRIYMYFGHVLVLSVMVIGVFLIKDQKKKKE
jgi:lysophospholipid acyltransferase 5